MATIAAMFYVYMMAYFSRDHLLVVEKEFMADEGVSTSQLGVMMAFGYFAYPFGKFVWGFVADRYGARLAILVTVVGTGGVSVALAFASVFPLYILAWTALRFLQPAAWAGIVKLTGHWVPPARQGRVLGILSLSFLVGDVFARAVMAGMLEAGVGWRGIVILGGAITVSAVVVWATVLKADPSAVGLPKVSSARPQPRRSAPTKHGIRLVDLDDSDSDDDPLGTVPDDDARSTASDDDARGTARGTARDCGSYTSAGAAAEPSSSHEEEEVGTGGNRGDGGGGREDGNGTGRDSKEDGNGNGRDSKEDGNENGRDSKEDGNENGREEGKDGDASSTDSSQAAGGMGIDDATGSDVGTGDCDVGTAGDDVDDRIEEQSWRRRDQLVKGGAHPRQQPTFLEAMRVLLGHPMYIPVCLMNVILTATRETCNTFLVAYIEEIGASPSAATATSSLYSLAGIPSTLLVGVLVDKLPRKWRGVIFPVGMSLMTAVTVLMSIMGAHATVSAVAPLLVVLGLAMVGPYTLMSGVFALEIAGPSGAGLASATIDAAGYCGAFFVMLLVAADMEVLTVFRLLPVLAIAGLMLGTVLLRTMHRLAR